jgi:uncharacterized protein YegP (UPF0339 family)
MKYKVYRDVAKNWRWRFVARNGEIIAVSSEGYKNRIDCLYAINLVKLSKDAPIEYLDR